MSYAQPAAAGRRTVGFVVVVALHLLLGWALASGLARKVVEVIKNPLETKIIEEVKPPEDKPPPPPPPKLAPPPAFIPPPEVRVSTAAAPAESTITTVTQTKPTEPAPAPAPAPAPKQSTVRHAAQFVSCDQPEYPRGAADAGEHGTTRLAFLIDTNGRPLEGRIESSSGYRRLDQAAYKAFGRCVYKPAIENGQAVQYWVMFDFEWKLDE
ncbi:energy transducer TonB [Niveibacterium umoris]|uniref:Protein TonB n=1 Tax=Niveibacterium umoris TaxID=1193620 RepID=A0A840BCG6_9RHOO|nr:energy transducer TonB [Niveibacterium umoris]MBB4010765.1 protein TonB [Niveibacterium umoris]